MNLHSLTELVKAHPLISGLAAYYLFAAWVDSLDEPTDKSSAFYRKTFKALHLIAANVKYVLSLKLPTLITPDQKTGTSEDKG